MNTYRAALQFSLWHFLGAMAFAGIACASVLNANLWWASGLFTFDAAFLVIAIMLAIYRHGPTRAFWIGAALAGGVHLLLTSPPMIRRDQGDHPILTDVITVWAFDALRHDHEEEFSSFQNRLTYGRDPFSERVSEVEPVLSVSRSLWTFALAILGGIACRCIAARAPTPGGNA